MKKVSELGVFVGNTIGDLNLVIIVRSVVLETEPKLRIHLHLIDFSSSYWPSVESHILSVLLPSYLLFLMFFLRVDIWFHSS